MKSSTHECILNAAKLEATRRLEIQRRAEIERTWDAYRASVTAELRQAVAGHITEGVDHLIIRLPRHRPIKVTRRQTEQGVKFHLNNVGFIGHCTSSLGEALAMADKSRKMDGVTSWGKIRRLRWALGLAFGGHI